MRLVPNQSDEEIQKNSQISLKALSKICKVKVKPHHGGEPYVSPTDMPAYKQSKAMEDLW